MPAAAHVTRGRRDRPAGTRLTASPHTGRLLSPTTAGSGPAGIRAPCPTRAAGTTVCLSSAVGLAARRNTRSGSASTISRGRTGPPSDRAHSPIVTVGHRERPGQRPRHDAGRLAWRDHEHTAGDTLPSGGNRGGGVLGRPRRERGTETSVRDGGAFVVVESTPREVSGGENGYRIFTLADLRALPPASAACIVGGGILTVGGKLLLYGRAGLGKTTLILELAACLASGEPFLGRFPIDRPRRVTVVQLELSQPELAAHGRAIDARFTNDLVDRNLRFVSAPRLKLPRMAAELRSIVRDAEAEILIFDPFIKLFGGDSTDKPEQVQAVFDEFDALLSAGDIAAVGIVHHQNVLGGRTAGSWEFEAWPSTVLKLSGSGTARRLLSGKIRFPGFPTISLGLRWSLADGYEADERASSPSEGDDDRILRIIREEGGTDVRVARVRKMSGLSAARVRESLQNLSSRGTAMTRKVPASGGSGRPFDLVSVT